MISPKDVKTLPLDVLLRRIQDEEKTLRLLKEMYELRVKIEKGELK